MTKDQILNFIITEFSLGSLVPEIQQEMVTRIGEMLFSAVVARVMAAATQEQMDATEQLMRDHPDEPMRVLLYIIENIPGFEAVMQEEAAQIKASMAQVIKTMS